LYNCDNHWVVTVVRTEGRANLTWYYAEYSTFLVLLEQTNYMLHVSGYSGNAGSDALSYQNGMMFTTYDLGCPQIQQ